MRRRIGFFLILWCIMAQSAVAQNSPAPVDQDLLEAFCHQNKSITRAFKSPLFSEGKWSLLVFLSPECPLSKNYTVVIKQIAEDYRDRLHVISIVPGSTWSKKELKAFARKYSFDLPLYLDKNMSTVQAVAATTTPEVVLMDARANRIYQGAIDDWAVDLGKKRMKASREYLREAIQNSMAGIPVLTKFVQPVGCLINDF
ncbi:MAG TPA: thioredoxin fold domain-containing protein [Flavihumibacter sp.]|jgi:thiol-disulfide isomerase/thioredoxin